MLDQSEQNLNILGRLTAIETLIMGLLLQHRNHQQLCTQATKIIEMYEAEARKAVNTGDDADKIAYSMRIFAEAKANIAATAQAIR
jgi:hypothetical protein